MVEAPVRGVPDSALPLEPVSPVYLPESLRGRLGARIQRLGYLGAFFGYTAHQPDALAGFVDFTEALKAALPDDLTEVVALTVASQLGNEYERSQHVRLARRLGFDAEWIDELTTPAKPHGESRLDERQQAARRLALAMLADGGHGASPRLIDAVKALGDSDAVGVLLLVGRYVAHGYISNALELTDPRGGEA